MTNRFIHKCDSPKLFISKNRFQNKVTNWLEHGVFISLLFPSLALADFSTSLQSLVTGVFGGIFPAILMYEAGLAGLAFAKKTPDAKDKAEATAIGTIAVLGINGLWSFLKSHIK